MDINVKTNVDDSITSSRAGPSLGSNSVPNTSFINKYGSRRNSHDLIEVADGPQSNDTIQMFTGLQEVKCQFGNPDLSDITNANYKIPTQPTMTSLQGDDRALRVDVLWKVREESPISGASISNCHLEFEKFKNESKLIPNQFNKTDLEDGLPSRTVSERNGNMQIVEKKKDEEGGSLEKCGHERDTRRFTDNEPLERREAFSWPWHSGNYRVTYHFQNPAFRTRFSNKIILLKTIQWLVILCWILLAKNIPSLKNNVENLMWSLYSAISLLKKESLTQRISLLSVTLCLSHAAASLYIFYDNPLIPMTVLTLVLSYVMFVFICTCLELDVQQNRIFFPMSFSIFIFSIVAFWVVMVIRDEAAAQTTRYIGTIWCPSLLIAEIIASIEMSEVQSLISGNTAPLTPEDWTIAATFLL